MKPTLKEHDLLLMIRTDSLQRGDLCVFYNENRLLLKRVIGLPGDSIDMDAEGNVTVNGSALDEPYVESLYRGECDITFPYVVPEETYFVLGDNREVSVDSRKNQPGSISREKTEGKVVLRIWPLKDLQVF